MLEQRLHSCQLGPLLRTTGPLARHTASLLPGPLQLSSLDLLEQEVKSDFLIKNKYCVSVKASVNILYVHFYDKN